MSDASTSRVGRFRLMPYAIERLDASIASVGGVVAWGLFIGALSYGAGLLASSAPYASAAALGIVFFGVMGVAHVRRLVHRQEAMTPRIAPADVPGTESNVREGETDEVDADLRFARLLYYGGMMLIGQLVFRTPKVHLTVSDWLFFFSLCLSISVFGLRQMRLAVKLPQLLLVGIALFVVGGLLSSFGTDAPKQSIAIMVRLFYVTIVWFWLGTVVLRRLEHIWTAMVLWVLSASLDGAGAILQYFRGDVIPGGSVSWGRVTGLTQNVSDLGGVASAALVPALLIVLFQLRRGRSRSVIFGSVAVGFIVAGLILSGSVGSLFAACVATVFWFGAHPIPVRRVLALVVVGVALFAALSSHNPTYSQSAFDRISRFGSGSPDDPNKTLDSRVHGYHVALVRIAKDPFVGAGLDAESSRAGKLPVHNIIIGTWFETGALGLLGVILIFLSIAREAVSAILVSAGTSERALAVALASSFVAFLVFLLSEPALFTRYGWISAALIVAVRAIQADRPEQAVTAEPARLSLLAPAGR